MEARYEDLLATLGPDLLAKVRGAKVLVVGAGGIGCELLKDLVQCGFESIETIDLDTIDVSNLNRQFLFRQRHVGQSKAQVAREAVAAFNPLAKVSAHHGNIKAEAFGLSYFGKFDLVFNALDNIGARRHVNRLCLAKDLPLIESGTTGYNGQVQPIRKAESKCYECEVHDPPKAHPICTIRATPSKPVHCIVWAKELFKLLFGGPENSMLYEAPGIGGDGGDGEADGAENAEAANGAANGAAKGDATTPDGDATTLDGQADLSVKDFSGSTFMPFLAPPPAVAAAAKGGTPASKQEVAAYAAKLFGALFEDEVVKKIGMDIYKGAEKVPVPLSKTVFAAAADDAAAEPARIPSMGTSGGWRQAVWTNDEAARELVACVCDVWTDPAIAANVGALEFDKDDRVAMRFVAAAAVLRSNIFSIAVQSYHDAKGIAGNIIPAIATTNAIVAGLQVLEGLKILREEVEVKAAGITKRRSLRETNKFVWVNRTPASGDRYIAPTTLEEPNSDCYVCSQGHQSVHADLATMTLGDFLTRIVKDRFGVIEPNVVMGESVVYEEGEDCDTSLAKNLSKPLAVLPGCSTARGGEMTVDDFRQDLNLHLRLHHKSDWDEEDFPDGFFIGDELPKPAAKDTGTEKDDNKESGHGAGGVEVEGPSDETRTPAGTKRKREAESGGAAGAAVAADASEGPAAKRRA